MRWSTGGRLHQTSLSYAQYKQCQKTDAARRGSPLEKSLGESQPEIPIAKGSRCHYGQESRRGCERIQEPRIEARQSSGSQCDSRQFGCAHQVTRLGGDQIAQSEVACQRHARSSYKPYSRDPDRVAAAWLFYLPLDAALPFNLCSVEDRSLDAGALPIPTTVGLANPCHAAKANADATCHRCFERCNTTRFI